MSPFPFCFVCYLFQSSSYPSSRVDKDSAGVKMGVMGSVNLIQNAVLSTQPVSSFDWHPDKVGTLRVQRMHLRVCMPLLGVRVWSGGTE